MRGIITGKAGKMFFVVGYEFILTPAIFRRDNLSLPWLEQE